MTYPRLTVSQPARFDGPGLHTGEPTTATVHPGSTGIRFIANGETVPATPDNVTDTTRCTRLRNIAVIEHLMSALAALEITDADVEVVGRELPALDGGAGVYVHGLVAAGAAKIGETSKPNPFSRIYVHDENAQVSVSLGTGKWRYVFETGDRWPGTMAFDTGDIHADFAEGISPARTFAFDFEVEKLRGAGLGQGLDESNALVLGEHGYLNPAKFADEPARHKMLDLAGDLYLAGIPLRFLNAVGERSGHKLHVEAARSLMLAIQPRGYIG